MKVVIGCDINEYYVQISYAKEGEQPETLELSAQGDPFNMETALCKRTEVNQWYIGREAVSRALAGKGTLVEHLLPLLLEGKAIEIEGISYEIVDLCNLFLSRVLTLAIQKIEEIVGEKIETEALIFTSGLWEERLLAQMDTLVSGLAVEKEKIFFQSHEESLYSFLVHQPEKLWGYVTVVLDFTSEMLVSYRVEMNHKTRPIVTFVQKEISPQLIRKKHYASIMENDRALMQLDEDLLQYLEEMTRGQIITSMYLVGDGFHGEWYPKSLKLLCRNRKVFAGNNLYSKGACFSALERIWPGQVSETFLFLGQEMLKFNVGLMMQSQRQEVYYPLLDAGTNWYEAKAQLTFMMGEADEIQLRITPLEGGGPYDEILVLKGMENRPRRTLRLAMQLQMQSERQLDITLRDEGFGEFFAPDREPLVYHLVLTKRERENG